MARANHCGFDLECTCDDVHGIAGFIRDHTPDSSGMARYRDGCCRWDRDASVQDVTSKISALRQQSRADQPVAREFGVSIPRSPRQLPQRAQRGMRWLSKRHSAVCSTYSAASRRHGRDLSMPLMG
jgi:hypothetical protein